MKQFVLLALLFAVSVSANIMHIDASVEDIEQYDIDTGEFTFDMIIGLQCNFNCSPHDLWFANGVIKELAPLGETKYRVRAEFASDTDVRNYPFDTQMLEVIMQPKSEQTQLVAGRSFVSDTVKGFDTLPAQAEVTPHYGSLGDAYDQYKLSIGLKRNPIDALTSIFIPLMFFMIVIIVSYLLDVSEATLRVEIALSILLTVVLFHQFFEETLPDRSYMTFTDVFMIFTYFVCLATLLLNIWLVRLLQQKKRTEASQLYTRSKYAAIILIPLAYASLLLFLV